MFYTQITKKRNEWLASEGCTIGSLLEYIEWGFIGKTLAFEGKYNFFTKKVFANL